MYIYVRSTIYLVVMRCIWKRVSIRALNNDVDKVDYVYSCRLQLLVAISVDRDNDSCWDDINKFLNLMQHESKF